MTISVLWDGRRDGPGGAQLMADEPARRLAPQAPIVRPTQAVRDQLAQRPMTLQELSQATGIAATHLHEAIGHLRRMGEVAIVGTVSSQARRWRRACEPVYGRLVAESKTP